MSDVRTPSPAGNSAGNSAGNMGRRVENSEWLERAIRVGFVAYGAVHLLIAWLAIQLALGNHSKQPNQKGAMQQLAKQPFGHVLVWAVALGMICLVVWRLIDAAFGHSEETEDMAKWRKRATSLIRAIVYGVVAFSALRVAVGAGSQSKGRSTTAKLMDQPFGRWLVGIAGLVVLGYGAYMAYRGFTEKYRKHLDAEGNSGKSAQAYIMFGKVGYIAKGASIAIVGLLFLYAAITHEPKKSGGLDDALRALLQQPFGPVLLFLIAIGIGAYGLFCFARARHLAPNDS
jgi:hypothetical protein